MSTHKFINNVELSTFNDEYFQTINFKSNASYIRQICVVYTKPCGGFPN